MILEISRKYELKYILLHLIKSHLLIKVNILKIQNHLKF